jgi:hypothetical protein
VPWVGILFGVGVFTVLMIFLLQAVHRSNEDRAEYRAFMNEVKTSPYREDPHQQLTVEELAMTRPNTAVPSYTELSPAALARYIQNNLVYGEDEYVEKYWARIFNHVLGDEYARADRLLRQSYIFEHATPKLRKALRVLEYKIGLTADADSRNRIQATPEPEDELAAASSVKRRAPNKVATATQDEVVEEVFEVIRPPDLPTKDTPLETQNVRELAEYINAYLIENPKDDLVQFTWYKALESVRNKNFANADMQLTHSNFVDGAHGKLKEALTVLKQKIKNEIRAQ